MNITLIRNWWNGYHQPAICDWIDDPAICQCGHYLYLHSQHGCPGFSRAQPLPRMQLRCRCKIQKKGRHR